MFLSIKKHFPFTLNKGYYCCCSGQQHFYHYPHEHYFSTSFYLPLAQNLPSPEPITVALATLAHSLHAQATVCYARSLAECVRVLYFVFIFLLFLFSSFVSFLLSISYCSVLSLLFLLFLTALSSHRVTTVTWVWHNTCVCCSFEKP